MLKIRRKQLFKKKIILFQIFLVRFYVFSTAFQRKQLYCLFFFLVRNNFATIQYNIAPCMRLFTHCQDALTVLKNRDPLERIWRRGSVTRSRVWLLNIHLYVTLGRADWHCNVYGLFRTATPDSGGFVIHEEMSCSLLVLSIVSTVDAVYK